MNLSIIQALIAEVDTLDTAKQIADLQNMIVPVLQTACSWGLKVGLGVVGAQAFYALVIKATKV